MKGARLRNLFLLSFILFFSAFFLFNLNFFNLTNAKPKPKASSFESNHENEALKLRAPTKEDVFHPNSPVFDRLIVLMVDALRHDFIFEDDLMEYASTLIKERKAVPFVLNVKTPTVTLPRLKAFLSGTVPEFIDILWNFNTTKIEADNVLDQFKRENRNLVFYGDDTWLKLFPAENYFLRHEGVTSFVASDFDEVDRNVTRNLAFELKQYDWDVMILHYLGLDHIGHIEGPRTENMKLKLVQMDDILKQIYLNITENDAKTGRSTLILLLSDHGMADHGGHGGSTRSETEIPVLFINEHRFQDSKRSSSMKKFSQIDLASTLSCLFNLRIPEHNEGVAFIDEILVDRVYEFKNLQCFNENFLQLNKKFRLFDDSGTTQRYMQLRSEYEVFANNREHRGYHSLVLKFKDFLKQIVKVYSNDTNQSKNQVEWMLVSILAMAVSLGQLILITMKPDFSKAVLQLSTLLLVASLIAFKLFESQLIFAALSILAVYFIFQIINITWTSCDSTFLRKHQIQLDSLLKFQITSFVFYLISLFSSSFIEEEHQLWYFVELTQIVLLVIHNIKYKSSLNKKDDTGSSQMIFTAIGLLCISRILRSMNQTGNKWLNEADIGDFLRDNKTLLVVSVLASLAIIFLVSSTKRKRYIFISIGVFSYQFSTIHQVSTLHDRNMIAQLSYLLLVLSFFITLVTSKSKHATICEHFLLLSCLIQPSHNLVTLCLWSLKAKLIKKLILNVKNIYTLSFLYYTISQACYFTQGNSNSLSTLQLSSSLVGFNEFNQVTSALLLFTSTHASQIYWFCNLIHNLSIIKEKSGTDYTSIIDIKLVMNSTITIAYTVCAFIQREHLFIWTVFAPKLIYQLFSAILELALYSTFRVSNKF